MVARHRQSAAPARARHHAAGKTRWVIERSFAWLHSFRRLTVRYERYAHVLEAFLSLACSLICWNQPKRSSD
ncbi:transposase [Paraburkholderia sp. SIMBA_030]|uniref:transposase n=1 Tax=Paraburkholderia sp. SIMBA_030 TaxID=3085773 RepID=UPI003979A1B4